MVILHITSIRGGKYSGISIVVPEHVKNQSKIETVALFNCTNFIPEDSKGRYKVYLKENNKFDINQLENPFDKPDLVVFHGIYTPFYIKIYKNLIKNNIPYIILPHGSLTKKAQNKKKFKKILANKLMFNKFIKNAKKIQYLSENERENSRAYKKDNFVSGNGIYIPSVKLKKFKNSDVLKFTYIGRLDIYHKGLDILLEAAKFTKRQTTSKEFELNIYGPFNGEELELKKYVKKYELENIVNIKDAIYGEEKVKILLDTDVFLQTSRTEGQPLGIMEAMAYGLPCIVTEGTTFARVVKENKCGYASDENPKEIANNIVRIIDNKEQLESLSINAYNFAKENFDWTKIANETIKKYKRILEEI